MTESTLFVVATPIGNLDDLSPRARQVLEQVDLIAAEDTRRTRRMLTHFGIKTRQISLHEHNEASVVPRLVRQLQEGRNIALVSDAGTPLISDPGYRLLSAAHENGIHVSPVPGASAVVAALSVAGLPTDRFCFEGFLPAKKAARRKRLTELASETRTQVFFEAAHRAEECIADMMPIFGPQRRAFIGREMTKVHEQCVTGTLEELKRMIEERRIELKGEFVLAVEGRETGSSPVGKIEPDQLLRELLAVLPGSQAADIASRITGRKRNEMYRLMLEMRDDAESP